MYKYIFIISLVFFIIFNITGCKKNKQDENTETSIVDEPVVINPDENLMIVKQGMQFLAASEELSNDGKKVVIYNKEVMETQWGDVYGVPIIFLCTKDNRIITSYNLNELLNDDFFGGAVEVKYNNERNSFDMVFNFYGYGDYGTAYIDLNTNELIRELLVVPIDEDLKREFELQGLPR